jgi:TolB protein
MSVFGGTPRQLIFNIDSAVSFAPDGNRLTFLRWLPDQKDNFSEIHITDKDGGNDQVLYSTGEKALTPVWSPDGSRIAFNSEGDRENGIFVMRSDGTEVTRLTRDFGDATEPVWSHDGTRIYFNSQRSGNNDIYSIAVPRGTGERLTEDVGEDNTPAFCPVGNEVAFSSNRSGKFQYFSAGSIHRPGGEPDT